ncbi:DUF805 domain-containing protein [Fulvimarina sp. MAC8]|uniref:DUF805 domain-containing protein n=1 Tax=Fulvimarina sp. MAC8 TaxID=3162874 RepID=UPI0032F0095C
MTDLLRPYKRYFQFSGRARRKEYWLFTLWSYGIFIAAMIALGAVAENFGDTPTGAAVESIAGIAISLWFLLHIIPYLAVTVRRLHDIDYSGFAYFISFIPGVGPVILVVLCCLRGTPGRNRFGPNPKGFSDEEAQEVFS